MYVAYICILTESGVKIPALGRLSFQASKKRLFVSWSLSLNWSKLTFFNKAAMKTGHDE